MENELKGMGKKTRIVYREFILLSSTNPSLFLSLIFLLLLFLYPSTKNIKSSAQGWLQKVFARIHSFLGLFPDHKACKHRPDNICLSHSRGFSEFPLADPLPINIGDHSHDFSR